MTKLQNYELDRQEKKITDDRLQRLVDEKQKALDDAALETSLLQEKLAALEIKQDAIKSVIQKRDFQLEGLNNTIQSQQKDLALMAQERAELKAKITDNTSATDMAEAKWKASEEEAARLKKEIDGLRATSTNATEALTRQTLDATRAADELTRLKSQLTAKEAEIVTLQKNLDDMRTAPKK